MPRGSRLVVGALLLSAVLVPTYADARDDGAGGHGQSSARRSGGHGGQSGAHTRSADGGSPADSHDGGGTGAKAPQSGQPH